MKQFLQKYNWKALLSTCLLVLAGSAVFANSEELAEAEPKVLIDAIDLKWWMGEMTVYMTVILLLVLYIVVRTSPKLQKTFSLKAILDSVVGRNQKDEQLDHEYDGIRELDNPMPAWLQIIFYITIAIAPIYLIYFHVLGSNKSQYDFYNAEVKAAEEKFKDIEIPAEKLVMLEDDASKASGKAIYDANCAACHGMEGEGKVGPNFTDQYWIHGGGVKNIYETVKVGVPDKGMIAWKGKLSAKQRHEVSSYIWGLQGKKVKEPKEPEGELYVPGEEGSSEAAVEPAQPDSAAAEGDTVQAEG